MADEQDSLVSDIDLYDSEILAIEGVVKVLNTESRRKETTVEGWRNEIVNRFAEINMRASVVLHSIEGIEDDEGLMHVPEDTRILTTITIEGRIDEPTEFDHDRMRHEVQANIRGLDQPEAPSRLIVPGVKKTASGLIVPGR